MIKRVMISVLCMILLSACDTGSNTSGGVVNSGSYAPIDLSTASEDMSGMILAGALDHNTGGVDAFWIPTTRGQDAYRNLEVETRNGYLLRFFHRTGIPDGTYPIDTTLNTTPADTSIAGGLLYLWSPDEALQFTQNPIGTLTIRHEGNNLIGEFSLSVENLAGDSVVIEGQFYTQFTESALR